MAGSVHDAANYQYQATDIVVPDANVCLDWYPPPSDPAQRWSQKVSSAALKAMLLAKCGIRLHPLVLGEYLNRYAHLEWKVTKGTHPDKPAKRSADYTQMLAEAVANAKEILKLAAPIDVPTTQYPINDLLGKLALGGCDWNDLLIAEACKANGWKLLSHDADHYGGGFDLLTGNGRLLKRFGAS